MVVTGSQNVTRILLIGGGHTHVVALRRLASMKPAGLDIHLVSPEPSTSYSGLLPGHIAGHWPRTDLEIPLAPLCHPSGTTLHTTRAISLDPSARIAGLDDGRELAFEYASLDIGAIAAVDAPDGLVSVGVPVKPLGPFADQWSAFVSSVEAGANPPCAAVIGAGTAGVELALSMKHRLDKLDLTARPKVALIERGEVLLPDGNASMRRQLEKELNRACVTVYKGEPVVDADETLVRLASGESVPARFVALATGARPQSWLAGTGLALNDGFVSVSPTLQSISHPHIFACGDTAHLTFSPRPKAGVFAVRQGAVLAEQIGRLAANRALSEYHPQTDYLKLVSLGRRRAIAEKWGVSLNLPGMWSLKRHIDFDFMKDN
ncbi:FAD-dependent oxidoreductase [Hyphomonas sp.]|uniref:FAD-dependent oxidoreductase n=1 Tax=Hyphomonas sp. TaxID=87 RepID=UPI0032EF1058